jgi:hypothetical protein
MEAEQRMEPQQIEQIFGMLAIFEARLDELLKDMKNMRKEGMKANMDACMADIKDNREEMMACQEKTEARLQEEPASEDMTLEVAHEQEVLREDAAVMPVRGLRKQHRG